MAYKCVGDVELGASWWWVWEVGDCGRWFRVEGLGVVRDLVVYDDVEVLLCSSEMLSSLLGEREKSDGDEDERKGIGTHNTTNLSRQIGSVPQSTSGYGRTVFGCWRRAVVNVQGIWVSLDDGSDWRYSLDLGDEGTKERTCQEGQRGKRRGGMAGWHGGEFAFRANLCEQMPVWWDLLARQTKRALTEKSYSEKRGDPVALLGYIGEAAGDARPRVEFSAGF
jgi:hypothetical protein